MFFFFYYFFVFFHRFQYIHGCNFRDVFPSAHLPHSNNGNVIYLFPVNISNKNKFISDFKHDSVKKYFDNFKPAFKNSQFSNSYSLSLKLNRLSKLYSVIPSSILYQYKGILTFYPDLEVYTGFYKVKIKNCKVKDFARYISKDKIDKHYNSDSLKIAIDWINKKDKWTISDYCDLALLLAFSKSTKTLCQYEQKFSLDDRICLPC